MKMKKINILAIGLVACGLFSACNKEVVNTDPEVPEGKILLKAGYENPRGNEKYTFNIDLSRCFFNLGDSVYINGLPYAVFPYETSSGIESDTASSRAHIWADISTDNHYKAMYPKEAFASSIGDVDNPTVIVPSHMKAIPSGPALPTNVHIHANNDGRIMPTTAYSTSTGLTDSLFFRNTVSLLYLSLKYNYAFGNAIDNLSSTDGYPVITVDSVRLTSTTDVLSGNGSISNPYSTNPVLVLNSTGSHTITYTFTDTPSGLYPTSKNAQEVGFMPIVPNLNSTINMEVFFKAVLKNGTGATRHYVYSKTGSVPVVTERNKILSINVPFSTASDFNTYVTLQ